MTRRPYKLTDRQRRGRYFAKRGGIAVGVAIALCALMFADRLGSFGRRPPDDVPKYHDQSFRVAKVVDGDTLDVDVPDGRWPHTRIRLWGMDTPETVKPDTPVQHYGPEASAFTKHACQGQTVRLELVARSTRDRYGRLLAYVYLPDGTMLNRTLVEQGYAYADPRYDHPHRKEFARLEREALAARRGLWQDVKPADLPYYHRDTKLPERPASQP